MTIANALIAAATAADDSSAITIADGASIQVYATPRLTGAEQLTVTRNNGTTYQPVLDKESGGVVLNHRVNSGVVKGPGQFIFSKTATKVATAVAYDT
jgi:hypothetical protein